MSETTLPQDSRADDESNQPEVRLELTQAGVRQVLSLYAEEQAGRIGYGGVQFGVADLIAAILRHWLLVTVLLVVGGLLGYFVSTLIKPLYTLTAQVVVEQQDPTEEGLSLRSGGSAFIATQAEIMQSRSVLEEASRTVAPPVVDTNEDAVSKPVDSLIEALQASAVSGTQVVALSYIGEDPNYGQKVIHSTIDAYRNKLILDEQQNQNRRLKTKTAEYVLLGDELERLEVELSQLRSSNPSGVSAEDAIVSLIQVIRDQTQRLGQVRQARLALESQLSAGTSGTRFQDPVARGISERLAAAEAELARVSQTLRPGHPTVDAARQEVRLLSRQLSRSESVQPQEIQKEIDAASELEAELTTVLSVEQVALNEAQKQRRVERLIVEEVEQIHELVEERRRALLDQRLLTRLAEAGEIGVTARIIEEPVVPEMPTWPKPPLMIGAGGLVGAGLAVCWAVFSFRRSKEVLLNSETAFANGSVSQ